MQDYGCEFAEIWFHVPTKLEIAGALWLVRSGRNVAKPNYVIGPKVIECYGFHFVMEGKVKLEFEGGSVDLQKNDMFCLLPHTSYTYRTVPSSKALQMAWITLDGSQLPELLAHIGVQKQAPYKKTAINRSVRMVLGQLMELFTSKTADLLLRQSLLLRLFALLGSRREVKSMADTDTAGLKPGHWIADSLAYIRLHYTEHVSVEELAKMAGVHRSHFSSVFAREAGLPPQQLILRLRMEKAVSLLADGSLSITETAHSVGYPDVYSFSRSFKKYFGRPPSRWSGAGR